MVEQNKPVRSRDEQIGAIANDWIAEGMGPDIAHERSAQMILEAEARGAAEQRRKDAEEQEVAYYIDHRPGSGSPPYAVRSLEQCAFPEKGEPVYTHPANVAALEDRVRVLEGVISAMRPGSVRTTIHSPTRFMDDTRAALTREGTPS